MIRLLTDEIRTRYVYLRINAESYVLLRFVHPQNFFDIFQNLGVDGTGLADKILTVTDYAGEIRIVTNSYGMHGSMRMGFTYHRCGQLPIVAFEYG